MGSALGSIPVFAFWGAVATCPFSQACSVAATQLSSALFNVALYGYFAAVVMAVMCPFIRQARFVGYGLLTMVFIGPIAGDIGCNIIVGLPLVW